MSEQLLQQLRDLVMGQQNELRQLRHRQELLMSLVDPNTNSFSFHMLEVDATREQVDAVYNLMDSVRAALASGGTPISHGEFENRIYQIFPSQNGNYGFAEGIVGTLNDNSKWEEVYEYYKSHGMNI